MIIPEILKVRIRKGESPNLAYITYIDEKKVLRKKASWERWGDKQIEDFDNLPAKGFKVFDVVKRSSDWFGSGKNMFRILHPNGVQFEISAENLVAIMSVCDIVNQEFQSPMILAWEGPALGLIPTNCGLYDEYVKSTKELKKAAEEGVEYVVGDIYKSKSSADQHIYLGEFYALIDETEYFSNCPMVDVDKYGRYSRYNYNDSINIKNSIDFVFNIKKVHAFTYGSDSAFSIYARANFVGKPSYIPTGKKFDIIAAITKLNRESIADWIINDYSMNSGGYIHGPDVKVKKGKACYIFDQPPTLELIHELIDNGELIKYIKGTHSYYSNVTQAAMKSAELKKSTVELKFDKK